MSKRSLETYNYQDLVDGQIRILHLQAGEFDDSVFIEISAEMLDQNIEPYKALSWAWGPESVRADGAIRVKNKTVANLNANNTDGSSSRGDIYSKIWTLPVKPNLLAALKRLRKGDKILRLWVDSICINQIDSGDVEKRNEEKSNQISMMTKIFGMAEEVCVWLGEKKDNSDDAIDFIHKLVDLGDCSHIAELEKRSFKPTELAPLITLLKRSWFGRRWVVQEIAMAKKATLHCGGKNVEWAKLANAVALLEKVGRDGSINRMLKKEPITNHVSEYVGNISSLPAHRLVQNTTNMFRIEDERRFQTWRRTLEELVSYLAAFEASRLHDTIYAVLGLASDFKPVHSTRSRSDNEAAIKGLGRVGGRIEWGRAQEGFPINYETAVLAVYKDFLDRVISKSNSLDIICRPWAPTSGLDGRGKREILDLPSWIPKLSSKPFQPTIDGKMVRYNPDPLVGPASFRHKYYSASGLVDPEFKIDIKDPHSKRMEVKGFILDTIEQTWESAAFGNVPAEWLKAGNWTNSDEVPKGELWRTLVADRNQQGDDPDRWYPLVFQSTVKERRLDYGFDTHRLIHESTNAEVVELFRRVQAVVWNRRLIRAKGKYMSWLTGKDTELGALGLAPHRAQKGDIICIIFGCSVPLLLRPIQGIKRRQTPNSDENYINGESSDGTDSSDVSPTPADREVYTLLGECYIDHMMDGEAIAYFKEEEIEPRWFSID